MNHTNQRGANALGILLVTAWTLFFISTATAEELTIATFNCEWLTRPKVHVKFDLPLRRSDWTDAQRTQWGAPGFRDARFSEAIQAVADSIVAIDADVIALVEVGNDQDVLELRNAVAAAGLDYPHHEVCDSADPNQQFVAVLSKFPLTSALKTIPGRESYDAELDDPDTERDTGISKGMRVTFSAHARTFNLFIVHLISERGGHESDAQRVAQASILRRNYLPLVQTDAHVIVAGDMNDSRGQPALRRVRGRDDIHGDLIQTGLSSYFDDDELDERWTYQFNGLRNQIDHILLSRSIRDDSSDITSEVFDPGNDFVSDHRALVVTIDLP